MKLAPVDMHIDDWARLLGFRTELLVTRPAFTYLSHFLLNKTLDEVLVAGRIDLGVFNDTWGHGAWGRCCRDLNDCPTRFGPGGGLMSTERLLGRLLRASSGDSHGSRECTEVDTKSPEHALVSPSPNYFF